MSIVNYDIPTSVIYEVSPDTTLPSLGGITARPAGTRLTLINTSVNTQLLSDELTTVGQAATAADRFAFNGYDYPLFGKSSVNLVYSSALSRWVLPGPQRPVIPPPRLGSYQSGHMAASPPAGFTSNAASGGTASNFNGSGIAKHPGVIRYTLGTSTTGSGSNWVSTSNEILLGASIYWRIEWVMKLIALSDGTNRYTTRLGFIQSSTAESANGVFFRYTDNVNSGKWERVTRDNNTETATDTTVTAQTSTWSRFTIIVNPAANNAQFFIDGTSVGANTTNIPTAAGRSSSPGFMFLKSLGTADNAAFDIGSVECIGYFNTSN